MMTQDDLQSGSKPVRSRSISELSILKVTALVLLIFVHSDLAFAYPAIVNPIDWFLLSIFFFVGGYLAYASFSKRGKSLKVFFKSKALTLYAPFAVAVVFYLVLDTAMGASIHPMAVFSQISMLNVFASLNSVYNWGTLWFIPFLLLFMGITCVLEKYVASTKKQLLVISSLFIATTLLFIYNTPLRLDGLFTQYLLVFVFGFYVSKFGLYEKLLNYKTAFVAVPVVVLFSVDLSSLFNYNTPVNALAAHCYFNCRSIMLAMGLVIMSLMILRKIKLPVNGLFKQISDHSAFIYLSEPFISFIILTYVFGQGEAFFANGSMFYLYIALRLLTMLVAVPLFFKTWQYLPKTPLSTFIVKIKGFYKNTLLGQ